MGGTWGTGWEVWLDGMKLPSLPTFNSVENDCRPVSIEITYGLERLAHVSTAS